MTSKEEEETKVVAPFQQQQQQDASSSRTSSTTRMNTAWDAQYAKLLAFYQQHQHVNVPRKGDTAPLAKWLGKQRGIVRRSKLAQDQVDRLDAVKFEWKSKSVLDDLAWNERLERLKHYKEQHGNTDVPQKYADDVELGTWVANQRRRYNQNTLRQDRTDLLNALQFHWLVKGGGTKSSTKNVQTQIATTAYDAQWNSMYERLVQYKAQHGHVNISQNAEGDLGMWVSTQRRNFHKKTWIPGRGMRQDRKRKLDEIGFEWNRSKKRCSSKDENERAAKKIKSDDANVEATVEKETTKAPEKEQEVVEKEPSKVVEKEPSKVVEKEPSKVAEKEPSKVIAEAEQEVAHVVEKEPSKVIAEAEQEVAHVVEKVIAAVQQETETQVEDAEAKEEVVVKAADDEQVLDV